MNQDPSLAIMPDQFVGDDLCIIIKSNNPDPIIGILKYPVKFDPAIAPEVFIGPGDDAFTIIIADDVVVDKR